MTKYEYLAELERLLAALPEQERRDAMNYYEEYFVSAGPEKEAEAIRRQADEEAEKVCASITAAAVAKREEAVRAAASLLLS